MMFRTCTARPKAPCPTKLQTSRHPPLASERGSRAFSQKAGPSRSIAPPPPWWPPAGVIGSALVELVLRESLIAALFEQRHAR